MELTEILKHKSVEVAATLPSRVEQKMHGIGNMSSNGAVLYLVKNLLGEDCKTFLNIGVGHGGSMIVAMATRSPCVHIGVDPFDRQCERTGINITRDQAEININRDNPFTQDYRLIQGKPTDKATIQRVHRCPSAVDLLFIDGNRSKWQARRVLANYRDMVRPGGIVVVDGHGTKLKPGSKLKKEWKTVGILGDTLILERK